MPDFFNDTLKNKSLSSRAMLIYKGISKFFFLHQNFENKKDEWHGYFYIYFLQPIVEKHSCIQAVHYSVCYIDILFREKTCSGQNNY